MAIEIKKLPKSEVEILIEISAEDFSKYFQEIFDEVSKDFLVDGFRPGKVPKEIIDKKIDHNEILRKAAERAIQKTYFPLLQEKKIEAIGRPEIVITKIAKGDSFCFKAKTAILPEIILPDYKKIAKETKEKSIKEEKDILESHDHDHDHENINKHEHNHKEEKEEEEFKNKQRKYLEIIEAISNASRIDIPDILIGSEKEKISNEFRASIENMGMKWEDYLNQIKKTEEELKKTWHEDAIKRIKYDLILRELAEKENIQVLSEEIEEEVGKILKKFPDLDPDYLKIYTYGIIRNEKVLRFLETC